MMLTRSVTPAVLFANQLQLVRSHLPGVRDGKAESIHDARVATRRTRELLRMAEGEIAADLQKRFRRMGRALGRVRDADVGLALLGGLEARLPDSAAALVPLRSEERRTRLSELRRLIKRLERLEVERVLDSLLRDTRRHLRHTLQSSGSRHWLGTLQDTIASRARLAVNAIQHATGVYFPNRTHAARIALKKLRYAMEVANETHAAALTGPLRDLKKGQDILGDLHDHEALLQKLPLDAPIADAKISVVRHATEAEIADLHTRYLSRRERLVEIARSGQHLHLAQPWPLASVAIAGVVAVSSGTCVVQWRVATRHR